jgi:hypothetical protein
MRRIAIAACVLVAGSSALVAETVVDAARPENRSVVKPAGKHDWLLKHPTIQGLLSRTNSHRAMMGRGPVQLNAELSLAAQRHANWMAATGAYQHSGLPYREIIFAGPTSVEAAVQGWIASPAHHGILLSGTEAGFGYMVRNGRPYWVGLFR